MGDPLQEVALLPAEPSAIEAVTPREAMLRDEVQRRVRNALATVRSIFDRMIANGDTLESAADHFRGRLEALARHQGANARPGSYLELEAMIRDELHSFKFGEIPRITIEGPEVRLRGEASVALGLAIHELVTNSLKFGTLSEIDDRARLSITWEVAGGKLWLSWHETGVSVLGAAPTRYGFGREYIEEALPYQIGAESRFALLPGGVQCTITVPVEALEAR